MNVIGSIIFRDYLRDRRARRPGDYLSVRAVKNVPDMAGES